MVSSKWIFLMVFVVLSTACTTAPISNSEPDSEELIRRDKMNHNIQDVSVNLIVNRCSQTQGTGSNNPWVNTTQSWLINSYVSAHTVSMTDQKIDYVLKSESGLPLVELSITKNNLVELFNCQFTLRVMSPTVMVLNESIDDIVLWQKTQGWSEIHSFLDKHQTVAIAPQKSYQLRTETHHTSDLGFMISTDIAVFLIETVFCVAFHSRHCYGSSRIHY